MTFPKRLGDLPRHAAHCIPPTPFTPYAWPLPVILSTLPCHPERAQRRISAKRRIILPVLRPGISPPPYCGLRALARHPQCVHALSLQAEDVASYVMRPGRMPIKTAAMFGRQAQMLAERQGGASRHMWFRWSRVIPSRRDKTKPSVSYIPMSC